MELKSLKGANQDSIYLQYGLNDLLKEFVEKNTLLGKENLGFHDYRKCLSIEEQNIIFNKKEVDNLCSQLDTSNDKIIYPIDMPKNNFKMGVPLSTNKYS